MKMKKMLGMLLATSMFLALVGCSNTDSGKPDSNKIGMVGPLEGDLSVYGIAVHNGIDMACAAGTTIYASRGGVVEVAGYQADGAGNYIQLNHGDGFRSIYMHMTNYIVNQGDYVAPGQIIGYVGNTGLSKGNHLHFGISYHGTYVNPMEYIG